MKISNWNKIPSVDAEVQRDISEVPEQEFAIRGNGRSYGDASLNNRIQSTEKIKKELSIHNATLTISSGYTLREALLFCFDHNYMFAVIPGTQYVSIGGMVAADVHGKNHKKKGTLGNWINSIEIQTSNGEVQTCSSTQNAELFAATIGGMGMTGIILSVQIRLEKLHGKSLKQTVTHADSFDHILECLDKSQANYQVAWIDLIHGNRNFLMEANFSESTDVPTLDSPKITIPSAGVSFLNRTSIRFYNWYHARNLKRKKVQEVDFSSFFFPLDALKNWNRLYGKKGFYQYQFVLPKEQTADGMKAIIQHIQKSKFTPYLTVLKQHGGISSPGIMSFPLEGYSLAIDFKNAPGITAFFKELDQLVISFKGRLYLAKDARLDADAFNQMYPQSEEFRKIIRKINRGTFQSFLSKRLLLFIE